MNQNEINRYDEHICETLLNVGIAVKQYYRQKITNFRAKRLAGILTRDIDESENIGKCYEATKKYYESLCNEKLEKLGLTPNNYCFERIMGIPDEKIREMETITYNKLKPYIIGYFITREQYEKAKENLKMMEENTEKIAVRSGEYFNIFERGQVPNTLINTGNKVSLNGEVFELYQARTLQDERKVDASFGESMGYFIESFIVDKDEECEESSI